MVAGCIIGDDLFMIFLVDIEYGSVHKFLAQTGILLFSKLEWHQPGTFLFHCQLISLVSQAGFEPATCPLGG